jgi:hypothetical protein
MLSRVSSLLKAVAQDRYKLGEHFAQAPGKSTQPCDLKASGWAHAERNLTSTAQRTGDRSSGRALSEGTRQVLRLIGCSDL